jgi:GTP-binding protein
VLLIDTAGIRRKGRVGVGVEKYSVLRALRAVDRADVVLFVMDATEPVTAQDAHIAGYIQQAVKGIVLIVNKWDLIEDKNLNAWTEHIGNQLKFVAYAATLFTSAKFGQGIEKVIPQAHRVYQERLKRLSTSKVNDVIQQAVGAHNPARRNGRQLKVLYATQADINPPTFIIFVNDTNLVHFSYQRYLENKLRKSFGFDGTPLRLVFKARREP